MSNWGRFFFGHFDQLNYYLGKDLLNVQKRTVPNWTFSLCSIKSTTQKGGTL